MDFGERKKVSKVNSLPRLNKVLEISNVLSTKKSELKNNFFNLICLTTAGRSTRIGTYAYVS